MGEVVLATGGDKEVDINIGKFKHGFKSLAPPFVCLAIKDLKSRVELFGDILEDLGVLMFENSAAEKEAEICMFLGTKLNIDVGEAGNIVWGEHLHNISIW